MNKEIEELVDKFIKEIEEVCKKYKICIGINDSRFGSNHDDFYFKKYSKFDMDKLKNGFISSLKPPIVKKKDK